MWTGEEAGRGRTGAPEWPKTTRFWASTGREQQVMLGPGAAPDGPALPERRMWQASSAGGHARNAYRLVVRLPKGTTLESGELQETLKALPAGDTVRTLHVAVAQVPADDVEATADLQIPGGGLHAAAKYTFGRLAAVTPAPKPSVRPRGSWGAPAAPKHTP